jgi:hypothetical protein
MEFQDAKRELLELAKAADACSEEYKKAYKSETTAELLAVVKRNANWCLNNNVISVELLEEWFGVGVLNENYIYISGNHALEAKKDIYILLLGSSQATIETWESSQATIKTWGSSQATIKTWGSSQATIKTWGSSQATIETRGSSQATIKTWGSSQATIKTWGSSQATIKTWGSSQATIETWESSQATIKTWGSSKLSYTVLGGLLQDRNKRKIFIKKSDYEIEVL